MMPNSREITDIRDSSVAIKQSIDNSLFELPEYENLEVVFAPEKHLLWLNMKPQRRPSNTMELLNDFLAAFHWITSALNKTGTSSFEFVGGENSKKWPRSPWARLISALPVFCFCIFRILSPD